MNFHILKILITGTLYVDIKYKPQTTQKIIKGSRKYAKRKLKKDCG